MIYPISIDDARRVAFLNELAILDTHPDASLDRIVLQCRDVFDVETCLISLVDKDRQWFKSVVGLDVCETERDVAFCNYTILGDEVFEVCDASIHRDFYDNALVTGPPYIRYYAGAPIVYDGMALGSMCIIDSHPREPLTNIQRTVLTRFAEMVAREIRVQRLLRESVARVVSLSAMASAG
jgi:GAF domain-containing protein